MAVTRDHGAGEFTRPGGFHGAPSTPLPSQPLPQSCAREGGSEEPGKAEAWVCRGYGSLEQSTQKMPGRAHEVRFRCCRHEALHRPHR